MRPVVAALLPRFTGLYRRAAHAAPRDVLAFLAGAAIQACIRAYRHHHGSYHKEDQGNYEPESATAIRDQFSLSFFCFLERS